MIKIDYSEILADVIKAVLSVFDRMSGLQLIIFSSFLLITLFEKESKARAKIKKAKEREERQKKREEARIRREDMREERYRRQEIYHQQMLHARREIWKELHTLNKNLEYRSFSDLSRREQNKIRSSVRRAGYSVF